MRIGFLDEGGFFQVGLENSIHIQKIEKMNLKQKKKMIPIVISTISHFWSPTLTTS